MQEWGRRQGETNRRVDALNFDLTRLTSEGCHGPATYRLCTPYCKYRNCQRNCGCMGWPHGPHVAKSDLMRSKIHYFCPMAQTVTVLPLSQFG